MNKILYAICFLVIAGCNKPATETSDSYSVNNNEKPLYVQMADAEMERNPDPRYIDFRDKPKWEYTNGLLLTAMLKVWERTGDEQYFNYAKSYADSMLLPDGNIVTYKKLDYNIDRVNPGKFLVVLHEETNNPRYKQAIDTLRQQMREHPRTSEGGFWHKKVYPHQMWLDGLYMGSPFLAQYGAEYNEPALFDEVAKQIKLIDKYTYDGKSGLYYHGWDESREQEWADKETGLSPNFWGRAMGWFSMALVDVLDHMPLDHPERDEIIRIANKLAAGIVKHQDEDSGVWYQVVDQGGREGNYLEASASSMFSYFLLKGVNNGYLNEEYKDDAIEAYQGVVEQFIENENNDEPLTLTNICSVAGLGGNPYRSGSYEYYISEPKRDNDPKGVGPFIMASLEYEKLNK